MGEINAFYMHYNKCGTSIITVYHEKRTTILENLLDLVAKHQTILASLYKGRLRGGT